MESLDVGDPLPGTGAHPQCNLLISWPRRAWSKSLRIANDMEPALVDRIETLVAGGRRVNLIHRRAQRRFAVAGRGHHQRDALQPC